MRPVHRLTLLTLALPAIVGCAADRRAPGRPVRIEGSGPILNIAVSPDGKRIAFKRYEKLYVADLASGKTTHVASITGLVAWPTWANRSGRLAVASSGGGRLDVWLVDLPNGRARNMTRGRGERHLRAVFSPDDSMLIFDASPIHHDHEHEHEDATGIDLWLMPSQGGKAENLTNSSKRFNRYATWSPDGKRIAFTSGRSGNREIWLMRLSDRSVRRLTDHPGWDDEPAWSPDGKYIAYVSDCGSRDSTRNIWVMKANGSQHRQLTFSSGKRMNMNPAWDTDSSSIFFLHKTDGLIEIRRIEFRP